VSAKLKASADSVPAIDKRPWSLRLNEARSVAEIVTIEARIAAAYWRAFRDLGLRERKCGDLPRSWLRFASRQKSAQFLGSKHASHPINALLNYAYVVEAGRRRVSSASLAANERRQGARAAAPGAAARPPLRPRQSCSFVSSSSAKHRGSRPPPPTRGRTRRNKNKHQLWKRNFSAGDFRPHSSAKGRQTRNIAAAERNRPLQRFIMSDDLRTAETAAARADFLVERRGFKP
jgi:CRISPR associated protein Cas1